MMHQWKEFPATAAFSISVRYDTVSEFYFTVHGLMNILDMIFCVNYTLVQTDIYIIMKILWHGGISNFHNFNLFPFSIWMDVGLV